MKKIICILIMCFVVFSSVLLSSCGAEDVCSEHVDANGDAACDVCGEAVAPSCTDHYDENADKLCDLCNAEFFPRCSSHVDGNTNFLCDKCGVDLPMNVKFTLADQEGTTIPGVTVIVSDSNLDEYTFVTDDDGSGTLMLRCGTYNISYDTVSEGVYFPEGYLPIPSVVTVSSDNRNIDIEILKTVPNGEEDRPFPMDEEIPEITIPASTLYHYIIYHSSGRNVKLEGESFKVVYGDKEYVPNENGVVNFTLLEIEANENSFLTIENTADEEITVKTSLYSDPGSYGNPFEISGSDTKLTANVSGGGVYYKYTATEKGSVTVKTSQMLVFKSAIMSAAKPLVKISGAANSVLGVYTLDTGSVVYMITISEDGIVIEDNDMTDESIKGSYTYTVNNDGEFSLMNGEDAVQVTLFKGGNTIVVTSLSDSKQTVISGIVESETISVNEGDELRIFVNSEYSDEVVFEIG